MPQTSSDSPGAGVLRPTPLSARSVAPDLARGAMLLLIALANAHVYLHGREITFRGYPATGSAVDRTVVLVQMTLVDGRAYPLFGLLFGYGIGQLQGRQEAAGATGDMVRRLVRRRGWWLLLFGFVHAALLFSGDILGAYGLLGVVLAGMLTKDSDRQLLVVAGLGLVPLATLGAADGLPAGMGLPSMSTTDPVQAAALRAAEWLTSLVFVALIVAAAVLLGAWAARRRLLDDPQRHARVLAGGALLGLPVAVLGGLPLALMAASVWPDPSLGASLAAGVVHTVTGYAGGLGYACLFGLVAIRLQGGRRHGAGAVGTALAACGQRSLTCYLAQSVVFVAVLAAYGGGLGDRVGVAATAVIAAVTWVGTVLAADGMRRLGWRGPFEVLLRRLSYPR